jgi:WD40 repeat protein
MWDAESGAALAVLRGHKSAVTSVSYSPDGQHIVSGSYDGTVRMWDAQSGAALAVLEGHERVITNVACSQDGLRIVSSSLDNTVRIWDVQTSECMEVILGKGDLAAIASEVWPGLPLRAISQDQEVAIELAGGYPVVWFPVEFHHITTHPKGCIWAGTVANQLHIIMLEGDVESQR